MERKFPSPALKLAFFYLKKCPNHEAQGLKTNQITNELLVLFINSNVTILFLDILQFLTFFVAVINSFQ
jgi:hypothetical protein